MKSNHVARFGLLFAICLILPSPPVSGQTASQLRSVAKFNRVASQLSIIRKALKDPNSDFEFTEDQVELLSSLKQAHQVLVSGISSTSTDKVDANASAAEGMEKLSQSLHGVLLPHQFSLLDKKVHERYLLAFGGDLVRMARLAYVDVLNLTEKQSEKLGDLESQTSAKLKAAKEEFKKEVEKINEEAERSMEQFLTVEQMSIIGPSRD